MKKLISFMLTLVMSFSAFTVFPVSAENAFDTEITESVQPAYLYTVSIYSTLTITNSKASCNSTVIGMSGTTIEGTQYLEKKVLWWWDEVDHWDQSSSTDTLYINNSKDNLSSGTYRVRTVATVYSGSNSEDVEGTSSEVTI